MTVFNRILAIVLTFSFITVPVLADQLSENRTTFQLILRIVSKEIEKNYYDPTFRGLDWKAATAEASNRIDKAQNVAEMAHAIWVLTSKLKDSHTGFVPPGRATTFQFGFDAKPIGSEVRVFELRKGGAAEKAGLQIGDRILKVNNFSANRASFDDMMWFFRVVASVPTMELVYQRDADPPQTVRIQAATKIRPAILETESLIDSLWELIRESQRDEYSWHYSNFDGIGYAQLRSFEATEEFMFRLVRDSQPSKALVIDLRTNGGGYIDTLKDFAGHFGSERTLLYRTQTRKGIIDVTIKPRSPYIAVPIVILVDSETGSAAEIFTRHMQLQRQAVVVGDISSGRVSEARTSTEQVGAGSVIPFTLQITTGRVVFPDGGELEKIGVKPDVECLPIGKDMREGRDLCLSRAVAIARKLAKMPEQSTESVAKDDPAKSR